MIDVTKNHISVTRGNTFVTTLTIRWRRSGEEYTPQEGDSIQFALKRKLMTVDRTEYRDPEPLVIKSIPIDTLELRLNPGDTEPLGFGEYAYDIKFVFADGFVDTIINNGAFSLLPEVD
jgi:hypothetical protein